MIYYAMAEDLIRVMVSEREFHRGMDRLMKLYGKANVLMGQDDEGTALRCLVAPRNAVECRAKGKRRHDG